MMIVTVISILTYHTYHHDYVRPGIVRCGEHSDYGTVTILFQVRVKSIKEKTRQVPILTKLPGRMISADLKPNL